jgi:hypothetical protein
MEFWYLLLNGLIDKKNGAYANFYVYGEHLGASLELVLKYTDKIELSNCELIEAYRLDTLSDYELPNGAIQLAKDVFFKPGLSIYKINKKDKEFISPTGIVKSTDDGEYAFELIKEQFVAYTKDQNGIFTFVMTPDKSNLEKLFFNSLDLIPSVDAVSFFLEDSEDDKAQLWINKLLVNKQDITEFLLTNAHNTIKNGYVSTVVYSEKGETNLLIDSHKQLKLTTKDVGVFNLFGKKMMALGYKQTKDFYSLEFGYYHWHYRPSDSLNMFDFRRHLESQKFEILINQ